MSHTLHKGSINIEPFTACSIDNTVSFWNFALIDEIYRQQSNTVPSHLSKKEQIITLFRQGKSCTYIANHINAHYSYTSQVISKYKKTLHNNE